MTGERFLDGLRRLQPWVALAAAAGAGAFLYGHRGTVGALVAQADPGALAGSAAVHAAFVVAQGALAVAVLRALGGSTTFASAFPRIQISLLGKYLPGKIWVFVLRGGLLAGRGVSGPGAVAASLVEHVFLVASGTVLFLLVSPAPGRGLPLALRGLGVAILVVLLAAPSLPRKLLDRLLGLLSRPPLAAWPSRGRSAGLVLGYLATWALVGWGVYLLAQAVAPSLPPGAYAGLTGVYAASVIGGFVALFAPGGIGVREGLFVVGAQPFLPPLEAGVVALGARLVVTAAEIAVTAACLGWWVLGRGEGPRAPGTEP